MKKFLIILPVFLFSCNSESVNINNNNIENLNSESILENETGKESKEILKSGIITVENDQGIENKIQINTDLYTKTTEITFHDPKDIESFEKQLEEIENEIKTNTGILTLDQIFYKARYLDYLGQTGEAIKLYEQNFDVNKNATSLAYSHNMAKLYETFGKYNDALARYEFLIKYFNMGDYLKDVANIYEIIGDTEKYENSMKLYEKFSLEDIGSEVELKVNDGVLEIE